MNSSGVKPQTPLEQRLRQLKKMPVRKTPPHKTLVRNLLSSKKLTKPETAAFEKMATRITAGLELTRSEKLWVETLNAKYLAKLAN